MRTTPERAGPAAGATGCPQELQQLVVASRGLSARDLSRRQPPPGMLTRPAAVLVLFGPHSAGLSVLLVERSSSLRSHAGQVAFPGGAADPTDSDAVATALREAAEETALEPRGVAVLGVLPALWVPPSNFSVSPVLGWWRQPCDVHPVDAAETASVHVVPVRELVDPANRGSVRHPSGFVGPAFWVRDLLIWGFTAGLLSRLFALAGWEIPWDAAVLAEAP
jgi:8-oxo-dGTP pyrophosphatase MutT (NUDIX family)